MDGFLAEWRWRLFRCVARAGAICLRGLPFSGPRLDALRGWMETRRLLLPEVYRNLPGFSIVGYLRLQRDQFSAGRMTLKKGCFVPVDFASPTCTVVDGLRVTPGAAPARRTIHLLGPSYVFGSGVDDSHTLAGFLQRLCDRRTPGEYRVRNGGAFASRPANDFLKLDLLRPGPGDRVFHLGRPLFAPDLRKNTAHGYVLGMHERCREAGAAFVHLHFPFTTDIANPSERELLLGRIRGKRRGPDGSAENKASPGQARGEPAYFPALRAAGCACEDLTPLFDRPHDMGEVFIDFGHPGPFALERMAARIFDRHLSGPAPLPVAGGTPAAAAAIDVDQCRKGALQWMKKQVAKHYGTNADLRRWLDGLPRPSFAGAERIGAVVMNANPFTLGHDRLVEKALARVDGLYLFVVEEDRSQFPFSDRLAMVRAGVAKWGGRVLTAGSGLVFASAFSFPGYFTKAARKEEIDASIDVALFGAVVAPRLGIKRRFVGEEPYCMVTRQYNDALAAMLPAMGVKLEVVPRRMEEGGPPISASRVRQALAAQDWPVLERMVPVTTYDYLRAGTPPPLDGRAPPVL